MLIVCSPSKLISDLVLLRVDPPFEESEFIKPIQYNNDAANLGPVSKLNEVSMFKWIELSEDKTCKKIAQEVVDIVLNHSPFKTSNIVYEQPLFSSR